jgi:GT2 family glycosyltransferase
MISIIICSRKTDISKSQQINLGETIGIAFEIICIDNSENKYSIFQAYNLGASQAKFPFLCFIHDDILFQTANWGSNLLHHFEDSEFGLIGVAGSQYKSKYLSGWGCPPKFMRVNITEIHLDGFKNVMYFNPTENKLEEVICIDGVFMATRKSIWEEYKFDEKTFSGFHCYDMDYSLQVYQKYKVGVCFDINIVHFARASYKKAWFETTKILYNKWGSILPLSLNSLSNNEIDNVDWFVNKTYCNASASSGERGQAFYFFKECLRIKLFKVSNLFMLFRIIGGRKISQIITKLQVKLSQ